MFDICIVGGGTVGLFLATHMARPDRKIVLIEAGSDSRGRDDTLLGPSPKYGGHRGSQEAWATGLGGTSQLWGGQLWPWQPWEFEGCSGPQIPTWGIGADEIRGYYASVLSTLGLPQTHSEIHGLTHAAAKLPRTINDDFSIRYSSWIDRSRRNFHQNPIVTSALRMITVMTGTVVSSISENRQHQVNVEYLDANGSNKSLVAAKVVLAAGTLGNTRVLSNSEISANLPALGSGFMDHVSKRVAEFDVKDWSKFRAAAAPKRVNGVLASPRIVPDVNFLHSKRLLPAYAHWEFESGKEGAVASVRSYLQARQSGGQRPPLMRLLGNVLSDSGALAEAAIRAYKYSERPVLRNSRAYLRVDVQQPARPNVTIRWVPSSTNATAPSLCIDWLSGTEENDAADALATALIPALSGPETGAVARPVSPEAAFADIFHMMGGTRMADSATEGVVNADLRVFGTRNVYVAGASVFPSGGMANPTYTALALAARLGDHLAE